MDHIERHAQQLELQVKALQTENSVWKQRYERLEKFIRDDSGDQIVTRSFFERAIAGLATAAGVHADLDGGLTAMARVLGQSIADQTKAIKSAGNGSGDSSGEIAALRAQLARMEARADLQAREITLLATHVRPLKADRDRTVEAKAARVKAARRPVVRATGKPLPVVKLTAAAIEAGKRKARTARTSRHA